ncbi:hypothetical protein C0J52_15111 [Blattella germanica]|nr:hypothetical protein C0J52_15111 [Blattella germanica]
MRWKKSARILYWLTCWICPRNLCRVRFGRNMIKAVILFHEDIDISCFPKVISFIKKKSVGYKPNQSKILSRAEVNRFMRDASDKEHLLMKVVAMIGVAGGCRRDELHDSG